MINYHELPNPIEVAKKEKKSFDNGQTQPSKKQRFHHFGIICLTLAI